MPCSLNSSKNVSLLFEEGWDGAKEQTHYKSAFKYNKAPDEPILNLLSSLSSQSANVNEGAKVQAHHKPAYKYNKAPNEPILNRLSSRSSQSANVKEQSFEEYLKPNLSNPHENSSLAGQA